MSMEITKKSQRIISVSGEIDISNVADMNAELSKCIEESPDGCIIDLSDTHYIDSAGIQSIVAAYKRIRDKNGKLVLIAGNKNVKDLLMLVRLDKLTDFYIFDDLAEAKNLFTA